VSGLARIKHETGLMMRLTVVDFNIGAPSSSTEDRIIHEESGREDC